MEGRSGTGRLGKTYFYYVCRNKECGLRAGAEELEDAVLDRLTPAMRKRLESASRTLASLFYARSAGSLALDQGSPTPLSRGARKPAVDPTPTPTPARRLKPSPVEAPPPKKSGALGAVLAAAAAVAAIIVLLILRKGPPEIPPEPEAPVEG